MNKLHRYRLNGPRVVAEAIGSRNVAEPEAVVVDLSTGTYHSITGDSVLLWDAVIAGATVEEIAEAVAETTGSTLAEAVSVVDQFSQSLVSQGLIVERQDPVDAAVTFDVAGGGQGLLQPRLETYSDMQDLILLDPVHEVDERGWPHTQAAAQE